MLSNPSPVGEGGSRRLTDEVSFAQTTPHPPLRGPPSPTGEGIKGVPLRRTLQPNGDTPALRGRKSLLPSRPKNKKGAGWELGPNLPGRCSRRNISVRTPIKNA